MYTHEIISFNLSTRPDFAQTIEMLDKTFAKHPHLEELIFHFDPEWQYQMPAYHKKLKE